MHRVGHQLRIIIQMYLKIIYEVNLHLCLSVTDWLWHKFLKLNEEY